MLGMKIYFIASLFKANQNIILDITEKVRLNQYRHIQALLAGEVHALQMSALITWIRWD